MLFCSDHDYLYKRISFELGFYTGTLGPIVGTDPGIPNFVQDGFPGHICDIDCDREETGLIGSSLSKIRVQLFERLPGLALEIC